MFAHAATRVLSFTGALVLAAVAAGAQDVYDPFGIPGGDKVWDFDDQVVPGFPSFNVTTLDSVKFDWKQAEAHSVKAVPLENFFPACVKYPILYTLVDSTIGPINNTIAMKHYGNQTLYLMCTTSNHCNIGLHLALTVNLPSFCSNGVLDLGYETGVDCGGYCAACPEGLGCNETLDCVSGSACVLGACHLTSSPTLLPTPLSCTTKSQPFASTLLTAAAIGLFLARDGADL